MSYLEIKKVNFSYGNGLVLSDVSLSITKREMVGLLGQNGSGKTTLLKLISGILRPKAGELELEGAGLTRFSRRSLARRIAVLPQQYEAPLAFRVTEVVALGRTPHQNTFGGESPEDKRAVSEALRLTGMANLGGRRFDELSGGERQKTILAMALAQPPERLLLDEPTVHLDIAFQIDILERVRELNRGRGLTVIAAMHDLNLASLYFERLILLKRGRVIASGTPAQVLTESLVEEAYETKVRVEADPGTGNPHIYLVPGSRNPT
ncbi:MAG: ABC transporter ATP-binding protein [Chloroflexota bacterium]